MIGIIDYGVGNLRSVQKAFEHVGAAAMILSSPQQLPKVDRLVLPGVGAFADGMELLKVRGWVDPVRDSIAADKPLLGICLGMQLLFEGSEEDAPSPGTSVPGLGVLPGKVIRFQEASTTPRLKVPHMGWNTLTWQREDPLLKGIEQDAAVYFVHSYYCIPAAAEGQPIASATADYGQPFCATAWRGNVWATQFHPEKSQHVGLKMLANFAVI